MKPCVNFHRVISVDLTELCYFQPLTDSDTTRKTFAQHLINVDLVLRNFRTNDVTHKLCYLFQIPLKMVIRSLVLRNISSKSNIPWLLDLFKNQVKSFGSLPCESSAGEVTDTKQSDQNRATMPPNATSAYVRPESELVQILASGGDDRLVLRGDQGLNKYFTRPEPDPELFFRGSCTCNFPTEPAFNEAAKALHGIQTGAATLQAVMQDLRVRLTAALSLPPGAQVIFTPSGSDAEYVPLLIAKLLHPGRPIVNVVTCHGEVGSGTLDGAGGRFFSSVLPLSDQSMDFSSINVHDPIPELSDDVTTVAIDARSESGEVVVAGPHVQEVLAKCRATNSVPIIHSVLGSKTGICEPQFSEIKDLYQVIDACQGRFDFAELPGYLEKNNMILFTASKFFRAPPFCGAVIVPKGIIEQLQHINGSTYIPYGLKSFLSSIDIPPALDGWKRFLNSEGNLGLALRWTAGLHEIEETVKVPYSVRCEAEKTWRKMVLKEVNQFPNMEVLENSMDTTSIVSVKLRESQSREWFTKSELAEIYKWMTIDVSGVCKELPLDANLLKSRCIIGQPVVVGKNLAILRVAVDSKMLRGFIKDKSIFSDDLQILKKLNILAENYHDIKAALLQSN